MFSIAACDVNCNSETAEALGHTASFVSAVAVRSVNKNSNGNNLLSATFDGMNTFVKIYQHAWVFFLSQIHKRIIEDRRG